MTKLDFRKLRNEYVQRSMRYANGARVLYDQALTDIARLFALVEYNPDTVFSFADYGKFGQVDGIMKRLESQIQQVIDKGIEQEFGAAYSAHDALLKQVLGENINNEVMRAFAPKIASGNAAKLFIRETDANNITRSTRVWNGAALGQMETAVQEALMEGMPAKQMAGLIEQYLVDPDSCFRRFRIKTGVDADGKSMYGRKWKKRVRHEDGTTTWFDTDPRDYPVGQGVYHSSYKNALRYTRTTTNIAYRTADYERYQTEDFVLGIEIKTTNNPTHKEDICDFLAGRYPKEFKWVGWHTNCLCYQVPILATIDEVNAMADAILNGEDPASVAVEGRITDVPDNFKQWVENNAERIRDAKELPYFLRDNGVRDENGVWHVKQFTTFEKSQFTIPDFSNMSQWKEIEKYLKELKFASKKYGFSYEMGLVQEALDYQSIFIGKSVLNSHYERVVGYKYKIEHGILEKERIENERAIAKILGVEKGEPMTFGAANEMKGNPHFRNDLYTGYYINCQSCVVAYELRRRGFDVEAMMNTLHKDNLSYKLSKGTWKAWIDPRTGVSPKVLTAHGTTHGSLMKELDKITKEPGRYHIGIKWYNGSGHIMTLERLEGKGLMPIIYDPQSGIIYDMSKFQDDVLSAMWKNNGKWFLDVYRVDNLLINPEYAGVVAKAGTTKASTLILSEVKAGWNVPKMSKEFIEKRNSILNTNNIKVDKTALPLSNTETGKLLRSSKVLDRFRSHCYNIEEVAAAKYIWGNPNKLHFVKFSPLGENKDLSIPANIKNIENKKNRKIIGYNEYNFEFNGKTYLVKLEIHKYGFEQFYCICK